MKKTGYPAGQLIYKKPDFGDQVTDSRLTVRYPVLGDIWPENNPYSPSSI